MRKVEGFRSNAQPRSNGDALIRLDVTDVAVYYILTDLGFLFANKAIFEFLVASEPEIVRPVAWMNRDACNGIVSQFLALGAYRYAQG